MSAEIRVLSPWRPPMGVPRPFGITFDSLQSNLETVGFYCRFGEKMTQLLSLMLRPEIHLTAIDFFRMPYHSKGVPSLYDEN